MSEPLYVLAASRPWSLTAFAAARPQLPGEWLIVTSPADLEPLLVRVKPRFIFFPHWSDIVPRQVLEMCECVCFHMTDLPFGRGGSPLQNLISNGHTETKLTALRMTSKLDAGPIYGKRALSLEGSAEEIFDRASTIICDIIDWIVRDEPQPERQSETSEPITFKRRRPDQSQLPASDDARILYNHIRMLDAPGYPKAYLDQGSWRLEFDSASLEGDRLQARVRFRRMNEEKK